MDLVDPAKLHTAEECVLKSVTHYNKSTKKRCGSDFLNASEIIEEGDTVIVYVNFGSIYAIEVKRDLTLNMKYGVLRHEYLIGKRYGSRVSATAGYVYALRPNAELWTRTLPRQTQILYTPDWSLILMLLDAKPGSVICESGTGSGSLSHAIALTVAPNGHLYTHEIDEPRVKLVQQQFKSHGLEDVTTCVIQNVCEDGFFVENACDGVFLDLPAPWLAIGHGKRALSRSRGGRLVSFSPCIEQVQRVCEALRCYSFVQVETIELVPKSLKVVELKSDTLEEFNFSNSVADDEKQNGKRTSEDFYGGKKRKLEAGCENAGSNSDIKKGEFTNWTVTPFPAAQPTHTGYLTSATLLGTL